MLRYHYEFEIENPDESIADHWEELNIMPQDSITHFAGAMFGDTAPISTFYVGLFQSNYLPDSTSKASELQSAIGEFKSYEESTRPVWERVFDGVGQITNAASRAEFTSTANARIYGGFLVSNSAKGGSSGLLASIARFETPRDIVVGQVLRVRISLNLIPAEVV